MMITIITIILKFDDDYNNIRHSKNHKLPVFYSSRDKGMNDTTCKQIRMLEMQLSRWSRFVSYIGKVVRGEKRREKMETYCRKWSQYFCGKIMKAKNDYYQRCLDTHYVLCLQDLLNM